MATNNSEATEICTGINAPKSNSASASATTVPPAVPKGKNSTAKKPMSDRNKNIATHAAAAAAAAGLGAGAAYAFSELTGEDNNESETAPAASTSSSSSHTEAPAASQPATSSSTSSTSTTSTTSTASTTTTATETPSTGVDDIITPAGGGETGSDEIVDVVVENPDEIVNPNDVMIDPGQELDDVVNPDDIAVALIHGDEIDPADIDTAEVLDFQDVIEVYDEAGGAYTAATYVNEAGQELMMIDVDNDDTFDVVADANGSVLFDENQNPISAHGMTVGDAEMNIFGNEAYLASSDTDATADYGIDSIADDLIS